VVSELGGDKIEYSKVETISISWEGR
jgi:hypothetical protein